MIGGKYVHLIVAFTFISMVLLGSVVSAEGNVDDIRIHVRGSDILAQDSTSNYEITLMDPQDRNWAYSVHIDADNITGASPLEIEPIAGNLTSGNDTFSANIGAMSNIGDMVMIINVTSPSGALWYVREFEIKVIEPIVISAEIFNSGDVDIRNATVEFYVDDDLISTDTLAYLPAGGSTKMSSQWVSEEIADGWHTSTVLVDVNDDGITDPGMGDIEINDKFYVEGSNMSATLYIILGITALFFGMVIINGKMSGKKSSSGKKRK